MPAPARAPGYDPLASIIGRWTVKGEEASYLETCRWYEGGFHVVCHTETRRTDGSTGTGMSILGYRPGSDSYTYHGIGSAGRNETMTGTFRDGIFEFHGESHGSGGVAIQSRVRFGPFLAREVPFTAETSTGDGPWSTDAAFFYVKLE